MSGRANYAGQRRKHANSHFPDSPSRSVSVASLLQAAVASHEAGRLDEAKAAYRTILKTYPQHVDTLQLLGVLIHQQGDSKAGLEHLEKAVALDPRHAGARNNIGGVLRALDQREAAERHYAAARRLAPSDRGARLNHGILLYELDRFHDASETFQEILKDDPACVEARRKQAHIAMKFGRHGEAEARFRELVETYPNNAEDLTNLAMAINYQGRIDEARSLFQKALGLASDGSELSHNLQTYLNLEGRTEDVRARFREALRDHPRLWRSEVSIAINLIERGHEQAGREILDDVLCVHGDEAPVWNDIGAMLLNAGRTPEAMRFFQKAIKLDPTFHAALGNLGTAFLSVGEARTAIAMFRNALKLNPGHVSTQVSLSRALREAKEFDQAHLFGRAALDMPNYRPEHAPGLVQLFKLLCDFDSLERLGDVWEICEKLKVETLPTLFLDLLVFARSPEDVERLVALVRKWAANIEGQVAQAPLTTPHVPSPDGRIRVGILSSDLRSHSVARFMKPLIDGYDRSKLSFHCYAPLRAEKDAIQESIRQSVDSFMFVEGMTSREIAQKIRDDGIDVLLELNGFTTGTRISALAYKPAPVQISWLGYPFTCGLKAIDYIIMDRFLAPDESTLVEEPVIMPDAWICFGKFNETEINPTLPMDRNGVVTFGTLNNPYKFNRDMIALWARVMAQVPNSHFLMVRPESSSVVLCRDLAAEFAKYGIGADRFFLVDNWKEKRDHLSYYNEIDISLDTFPVTGGTTTCEALWMGVPVVSMYGHAYHHRISSAILRHCGLDELCVDNPDDFVTRAVALTKERAKLSAWRTGLRQTMSASPLCDEPRFLHQFQEMIEQVVRLHGLR